MQPEEVEGEGAAELTEANGSADTPAPDDIAASEHQSKGCHV